MMKYERKHKSSPKFHHQRITKEYHACASETLSI